jgi:hypothetical protein
MENPNYLKLGDTGHMVLKLQKSLIKKGYKIKETGIFDSDTFRSVAELQRSSGLPVDGYVSRQIWQLLDGITPLNYYNPTDIPAPNFALYPYGLLAIRFPVIFPSKLKAGNLYETDKIEHNSA